MDAHLRLSLVGFFAALLTLSACGGNESGRGTTSSGGSGGGSGGSFGAGGGAAAGGANGSGGAASSGGKAASGGMLSSGGAAPSGGVTVLAGALGAGGRTGERTGGTSSAAGRGGAGTASAGGATGTGGLAPSGGSAGQHDAGATGGAGAGGQPGSDGGVAGDAAVACSRALLKSTIDAYFVALAAHSASSLPLAPTVKFTENGKVLEVGRDGLWKTAGTLKYAHSALDTEGCNSATEAVVPDGSMDIPFALRLKLRDQRITEIETIAVRPGDYNLNGGNFASDTNAIMQSATSVKWENPVPADQRNTREELVAWMDKYFRVFPNGVCNTTSSCKRLENGGGSFSCSAGASCSAGQPGTGKPAIASHIIFGDVETGIGVGFSLFMGNTDMHMFKMYGGQVYAVHAILGAATSTGWD